MTNEKLATEVAEFRKELMEISKEQALLKGLLDSHLVVADVIDTNVSKIVDELKIKVENLIEKQAELETKVILLQTGQKNRKEVFTTLAAWIGIVAVIMTAAVGAIKFTLP